MAVVALLVADTSLRPLPDVTPRRAKICSHDSGGGSSGGASSGSSGEDAQSGAAVVPAPLSGQLSCEADAGSGWEATANHRSREENAGSI